MQAKATDADRRRQQRRRLLIGALVVAILILFASVAGEAMFRTGKRTGSAATGAAPGTTARGPTLAVSSITVSPDPARPGGQVMVTAEANDADAVTVKPSWSSEPVQARPAGDGQTWTAIVTAPADPGQYPVLVTARAGQQDATRGVVVTVAPAEPVASRADAQTDTAGAGQAAPPERPAPRPSQAPKPPSAPASQPAPAPAPTPVSPAPAPKPPSTGGGSGQPEPERPKRPPSMRVIKWGPEHRIVEFDIRAAEPTADFGGGWPKWDVVRACDFYSLARPKPGAAYGPIANADRTPIYALRSQWTVPCRDAAPDRLILLAAKSPNGPWYRVTEAPVGPPAQALLPDELLGATELWVRTEAQGGADKWSLWSWYVTPGTWPQGGAT